MKKIVLLSLFLSLQSFAGGWSGNGGTSAYDKDNMWFLGEEPVPYCVMTSDNVPMPAAIEQMIRRNAGKWQEFFAKYGIDQEFLGKKYHLFPDKKERRISTQFSPAADCEAVKKFCSPQRTDDQGCYEALRDKILFLVGEPNKVIVDYLRLNGQIQGAAIRTEYNHSTYRTGGIVWVNDLGQTGGWSQYEHMLLHEMGHVLGMKHDSCWVMSEKVANFLKWNGVGDLGTIEGANWPYSFKENDFLWFTDSSFSLSDAPKGYYPNNFNPTISRILGFPKEGYFRVVGKIEKAQPLSIKIQIEEYPSQKIHELAGAFRGSEFWFPETNSPQLFTEWLSDSGTYKNFWTEFFQSGWLSTDMQGVLDWKGQKVSAVLQRKKGLTLRLYFPGESDWVTFQTAMWIPNP
jgi:hypothetical protein